MKNIVALDNKYIAEEKSLCPRCHLWLEKKKNTEIKVYSAKSNLYRSVKIDVLYCSRCDIAYVGTDDVRELRKQNSDLLNSVDKSASFKKQTTRLKDNNQLKREIKRTLFVARHNYSKCPICTNPVNPRRISLHTTDDNRIFDTGYSCGKHTFISPSSILMDTINSNLCDEIITLDNSYYVADYADMKEILFQNNNHHMMILLESQDDHNKHIALIISNYSDEIDSTIKVFDYNSEATRDILTKIIKEKANSVCVDNKLYSTVEITYNHNSNELSKSGYIVRDVEIRSGGGYTKSAINNWYELTKVLMYSPYTKRYELAPVTYDKRARCYFMDITVYRNFYRKYGKPDVDIYFDGNGYSTKGSFEHLNAESFLHEFGYNTRKADNLTTQERQEILADVIDLELMTPRAIVALLEGCIARQNGDQYSANREKWKRDINFVINYKVNTNRFVIAQR